MDENDLLNQTGLTREQLHDLLRKVDEFVRGLPQPERDALTVLPPELLKKEAQKVLEGDVKAGELEAFIKARTKSGVVVVIKAKGG